jgi:hypothetical protein
MTMLAQLPVRSNRDPVVAAWGIGLDSTAMLIELVTRGEAPDVVLTADTGAEREETYAFLPLFQRWIDDHGLEHHVVRYTPKRFKHWPPYATILENVLTNGTLPSISMGRGSCSLKWKVEPQDRWVAGWEPAKAAWAAGRTVTKLIGYDQAQPTPGAPNMPERSQTLAIPSAIPCGNGAGTAPNALRASARRASPCRSSPPASSVERCAPKKF